MIAVAIGSVFLASLGLWWLHFLMLRAQRKRIERLYRNQAELWKVIDLIAKLTGVGGFHGGWTCEDCGEEFNDPLEHKCRK